MPKELTKAKLPVGRPTKKTVDRVEKIYELARKGKTAEEIADIVGISERTLGNWQANDWEFSASLKENRELADDLVEVSLYKSARGYDRKVTQTIMTKNGPEEIEKIEHYPPSPTSMIYWLKNRRKGSWQDRTQQEVESKHSFEIIGPDGRKEDLPV